MDRFLYSCNTFGESDAIDFKENACSPEHDLSLFMPLRNAYIRLLIMDRYHPKYYRQVDALGRRYGSFKVGSFRIQYDMLTVRIVRIEILELESNYIIIIKIEKK